MMSQPEIIAIVSTIGVLFGGGGILALFKLGGERRQITVDAAQGAVVIQTSVLKNIQEQYDRLSEELTQLKMESANWEEEQENCRGTIQELKMSIIYLQRDLDRHGRIADLARRKSHIAVHAIGGYEVLVDELLSEMRDHEVPIKPEHRPYKLRAAFQAEMDKLEELESQVTEEAVRLPPPELNENGKPSS